MSFPEIKLGRYEHYKSTPEHRMIYGVVGVARHTETDELLVAYVPEYESEWLPPATMCVRPIEMFLGNVEYQGEEVPRFTYLGDG